MVEALFQQPLYLAARKMLDATVLRHEAIASNLANLNTPGYQRLDLNPSFEAELCRAMSGSDPAAVTQLKPELAADTNGGGVQLESELIQLNQNSFAHAVQTQLITAKLSQLRLAITGRAS